MGIKFDRAKVVDPSSLSAAATEAEAAATAAAATEEPSMQPTKLFSKKSQRHLPTSRNNHEAAAAAAPPAPPAATAAPPAAAMAHDSPERPTKKQAPVAQTPPAKKGPYEPHPSNVVSEAALNQLSNYILDQGMLVDQGEWLC